MTFSNTVLCSKRLNGETQSQSRLRLSAIDALNSGTQHLADIGRRVHGESDYGHHDARGIHRCHHHIVHQHEQHQHGRDLSSANRLLEKLSVKEDHPIKAIILLISTPNASPSGCKDTIFSRIIILLCLGNEKKKGFSFAFRPTFRNFAANFAYTIR